MDGIFCSSFAEASKLLRLLGNASEAEFYIYVLDLDRFLSFLSGLQLKAGVQRIGVFEIGREKLIIACLKTSASAIY